MPFPTNRQLQVALFDVDLIACWTQPAADRIRTVKVSSDSGRWERRSVAVSWWQSIGQQQSPVVHCFDRGPVCCLSSLHDDLTRGQTSANCWLCLNDERILLFGNTVNQVRRNKLPTVSSAIALCVRLLRKRVDLIARSLAASEAAEPITTSSDTSTGLKEANAVCHYTLPWYILR